jgi:Caspase domain
MNLSKLIILILLSLNWIIGQSMETLSTKTSLDVRFAPPDHIPPVVHLDLPFKNLIDSLPIYTKDSLITFSGDWSDNVDNRLYISINDSLVHTINSNTYQFVINIPYGVSTFSIDFEDYKKNGFNETYLIERNDTIDYNQPEIILVDPKTRGIKVSKIDTPFDDTNSIDSDKFLVRGFLKDESLIYSLKINDNIVPVDSNNFFIWVPEEKPDYLSIRAIDSYGNEAVHSQNLSNNGKLTQSQLLVGNYHALIIGIQNYNDKNIPSLDFPIVDAGNLINVLTKNYSFSQKNIDYLKDPSRKEIIQTFQELRTELSKDDNLLIFYAGHGYWDEDLQQGFWLPRDASLDDDAEWLSNGRVRDYIRAINTKHTLLIADACFSGGIFKSREISLAAPKSIQEMYGSTSRRAMTSGALKEVPDKSVFIDYLTKRLLENSKEFLSSEELFYSLKEAVINNSPVSQTPVYGVIHQAGDEGGGSFIFIKK